MSLERELAYVDYQLHAARARIETAYALDLSDDEKDAAFGRLVWLLRERELLRDRWARSFSWQRFVIEIREAFRRLTKAFMDLANSPKVRKLIVDLRALTEDSECSQPAFWRAFTEPSERAGVLGHGEFSMALPANRRPWLPGYMRQKARG